MKTIWIALGVAVVVAMAGCSDNDSNGPLPGNDNGDNGGGNDVNLQTFVVNNCNAMTDGQAVDISGQMFPSDSTTDPLQSVYTANCLGDQD